MLYASMCMQGVMMSQLVYTDYMIWNIVLWKQLLSADNVFAELSAAYISSVSDLMCGDILPKISAKGASK
jgi:hypothetical protein